MAPLLFGSAKEEGFPQYSRHQRRWLGLSSLLGEKTPAAFSEKQPPQSGKCPREDSIGVSDPQRPPGLVRVT